MPPRLSFSAINFSQLASDLFADTMTTTLDMQGDHLPFGGYDKLHSFIESHGILPTTRAGRLKLTGLIMLAFRIVQQQLGELGPVANFIHELSEDGIREQAKRILESAPHPASANGSAHGSAAFWDLDDASRQKLVSLFESLDDAGRRALHDQLVRTTTLQLAAMAKLDPGQLKLLLELLSPAQPKKSASSPITNGIHAVNGFLFPWMRHA